MAAQSEATPTPWSYPVSAKIKEWLGVAAGAPTVAALVIGGMFGAIKLANAPLQADIQAIHGRLDRMQDDTANLRADVTGLRQEVTGLRQDMNDEFKAVRKDFAIFSERLTRVETLLEQNAGQPKPSSPEGPFAPEAA